MALPFYRKALEEFIPGIYRHPEDWIVLCLNLIKRHIVFVCGQAQVGSEIEIMWYDWEVGGLTLYRESSGAKSRIKVKSSFLGCYQESSKQKGFNRKRLNPS